MSNYYILTILLVISSFLITFLLIRLAKRYSIVDIPNERSSHNIPTPRGGGLAIVLSWYSGITYLWFAKIIASELYFALASGLLLAIISLLDDLITIKPVIRIIIQLVTALFALYFLNGFQLFLTLENEYLFKLLINLVVLIGMVWFINLFNFLDGIDGYASIEAVFVAFAMYLFTSNLLLLVLIASVAGFLFWNWPKARIFMGDVGSTQLGFILLVLGIYFHNTSQFNIWQWIMITAVFWFDATMTLFMRWRNKEKLSQAHKKHAYQRIVQAGFTHLKTDLYLVIINVVILFIVFIFNKYKLSILIGFFVILVFLFLISHLVNKRKPFNS